MESLQLLKDIVVGETMVESVKESPDLYSLLKDVAFRTPTPQLTGSQIRQLALFCDEHKMSQTLLLLRLASWLHRSEARIVELNRFYQENTAFGSRLAEENGELHKTIGRLTDTLDAALREKTVLSDTLEEVTATLAKERESFERERSSLTSRVDSLLGTVGTMDVKFAALRVELVSALQIVEVILKHTGTYPPDRSTFDAIVPGDESND